MSRHSQELLQELGASSYSVEQAAKAESANAVLQLARQQGVGLAQRVAAMARDAAQRLVGEACRVDVLVTDRSGAIVGESD